MSARILIVDDVPPNSRLLEAKLTSEYYQVATASDGFAALDCARSWQPDLILLDVMMPGMDGFECCRRIKSEPAMRHIPVVMITALGEAAERVRGLEAGADDFLTKPVEYGTLMARVRSLVRLKRLLDEWGARSETARALGLAAEDTAAPLAAGARALVVDDWDQGAERVQAALSREGIVPVRARTSAEAMDVASTVPLDLILLSMNMAELDPLQLASWLRAADATHDVPMLLIGAQNDRERAQRGFDLGANDWLTTPVDPNELRARARNQIRRKFYQDRLRADLGRALEMAVTDSLTGLHNRRYLMRHLHNLLERRPVPQLAMLLVDIDHFKAVNDAHGHAVGDLVLKRVAGTLRDSIRAFDTLARHGGEEFAVITPGVDADQAILAAERLRRAVEAIALPSEASSIRRLTVSIGVACTGEDHPLSVEELLDAADGALYRAKRSGRNRVMTAFPEGKMRQAI